MNRHPYPAYKPSGINWLGGIPAHWEVKRVKHVLKTKKGAIKTGPFGSQLQNSEMNADEVKVYNQRNILDRDFTSGDNFISASKFSELRAFETFEGDLLITTRGTIGKCAVLPASAERGILHPCVMRLQVDQRIIANDYLEILIQDSGWILEQLRIMSNATTIDVIYSDSLKDVWMPLPPPDEQCTIAAFLDRETERIDALIEKKQQQIKLLREKRTALVHDAIHNSSTRTMRMGYVADQIFRPVTRKDDDIYTPVGLYNRGRGIFHKEPTTGAELGDSNFFWLDAGDLILSGQFAWEGAVALTGEKDKGCVATHRYPILRGRPGVMETAYLFAFFTTKTGDFLLNEHSRGAAGRNRPLNAGTLLKESIPVPPLETQSRVSAHVYFERRIVPIVNRSIQLLREYRTSLISAAVTGKIDVRKEPPDARPTHRTRL